MANNTDFLTDIYKQAEKLRLDILSKLENGFDFPDDVPVVPGAISKIENGILHITINECLPRLRDTKGSARIRNHWLGMIRRSLAGINISFKHALCLIVVYAPTPILWDADNRAVKFIVDAVRYCRLVQDDTWNYISFMVTGELDSEHPRTEIYIAEAGENHIKNILNMVSNCHKMAY